MHRQGHAAVAQPIREERPPAVIGHRDEEHRPGEQDRGRLARRPGDLKDHAGEDAARRVGEHDGADRLPAGGPQVPARLAEGHRYRGQGLARTGDNHREGHHRQGTRRGQEGSPHAGKQHERPDAEQGMNDARHARQVHHRQVDDPRKPVVSCVLVQIDPGQHPDRRRHQERQQDEENVPTSSAQMPPARM